MTHCTKCHEELHDDCFDLRRDGALKTVCRKCCKEISKMVRRYNRAHPKVKGHGGKTYESRNLILRELGFASYREYLASDLWRRVKVMVYKAKGKLCYLCGGKATELHHNRYHKNDLTGRKLKYINPICRSCHQGIEFKEQEKLPVKKVGTRFKRVRKEFLKNQRLSDPA